MIPNSILRESPKNFLGFSEEKISKVLQGGYDARQPSSYDSPIAAGSRQYFAIVKGAGQVLCTEENWIKYTRKNSNYFIDPNHERALLVSSGNSNTGIEKAIPSTKRNKGPEFTRLVNANAQQIPNFPISDLMSKNWTCLQARLPFTESEIRQITPQNLSKGSLFVPTWLLLYFNDKNEIRWEISYPIYLNNKGFIVEWEQRIIMPAIPINNPILPRNPNPDSFGNIPIGRR
ncbi:MAG: hypothetical protein ABF760_07215 [Zymomonas mobilis]